MDELNSIDGMDDNNNTEIDALFRYLENNANGLKKDCMELSSSGNSSENSSQSARIENLENSAQSSGKNDLISGDNHMWCAPQTNEEMEETFEMPSNDIYNLELSRINNNYYLKLSDELVLCQQIQTRVKLAIEKVCSIHIEESVDEVENSEEKLKQMQIKPQIIYTNNRKARNLSKTLAKNKNNKTIVKERRKSKKNVEKVVVNENRKDKDSDNKKRRGRRPSKNLLKQNHDIVTDHEKDYIIEELIIARKNPVGRPPDTSKPKEIKAKKLRINRKAAKKYRDIKRMNDLLDRLRIIMEQKNEGIISVKFKKMAINLFRAFYRAKHIFEKYQRLFPEQQLNELTDGYYVE